MTDREPTAFEAFVYIFDFILYPALIVSLFVYDWAALAARPFAWGALYCLGFVVWTLAEYWVHRSLLHGPFWNGIHERHHKHPREWVAFPFWQIPLYFTLIFGLVAIFAGASTPPVYAGILAGWVVFFTTHHLMHHLSPATMARFPWFQDFAIRHNAHHKITEANYGITTDVWDRVFGTFRASKGK